MLDVKKSLSYHKVIFAVDPTTPELRPTQGAIHWLKRLALELHLTFEGIFVWFNQPGAKDVTYARLKEYFSSLNLASNSATTLLYDSTESKHSAAIAMLRHAYDQDADLVVVSSRGRSGPGRLLLGSFAENLLTVSKIPILFLPEDGEEEPGKTSKILFPTDFSKSSLIAFTLFLNDLKSFQGDLILFHAELSADTLSESAGIGFATLVPEQFWIEQDRLIEEGFNQLMHLADAHGIRTKKILRQNVHNIPRAIEWVAEEERVELIVMASRAKSVGFALLGGIAKEIFRMKRWPVWVYGPEAIRSAAISATPRLECLNVSP